MRSPAARSALYTDTDPNNSCVVTREGAAMKYLVLIGCLLAWGCQTTPQAITDFDPAVDFSRY